MFDVALMFARAGGDIIWCYDWKKESHVCFCFSLCPDLSQA